MVLAQSIYIISLHYIAHRTPLSSRKRSSHLFLLSDKNSGCKWNARKSVLVFKIRSCVFYFFEFSSFLFFSKIFPTTVYPGSALFNCNMNERIKSMYYVFSCLRPTQIRHKNQKSKIRFLIFGGCSRARQDKKFTKPKNRIFDFRDFWFLSTITPRNPMGFLGVILCQKSKIKNPISDFRFLVPFWHVKINCKNKNSWNFLLSGIR